MTEKNYYDIPRTEKLLIANKDSLLAFFFAHQEPLLEQLYKQGIFTTPGIYKSLVKQLSTADLKMLRRFVHESRYHASRAAVTKIMEETKILTASEAFAVLCARDKHMDILLDDPRKIPVIESYSVHGIRPSDIVLAAAITEKR